MKWEKAQEGLKACPFVVLVPRAWGSNDDGHHCCWLIFLAYIILFFKYENCLEDHDNPCDKEDFGIENFHCKPTLLKIFCVVAIPPSPPICFLLHKSSKWD
jgi:hypothetical protein